MRRQNDSPPRVSTPVVLSAGARAIVTAPCTAPSSPLASGDASPPHRVRHRGSAATHASLASPTISPFNVIVELEPRGSAPAAAARSSKPGYALGWLLPIIPRGFLSTSTPAARASRSSNRAPPLHDAGPPSRGRVARYAHVVGGVSPLQYGAVLGGQMLWLTTIIPTRGHRLPALLAAWRDHRADSKRRRCSGPLHSERLFRCRLGD